MGLRALLYEQILSILETREREKLKISGSELLCKRILFFDRRIYHFNQTQLLFDSKMKEFN